MIKIGLVDFTPEAKVLSIFDKNDVVKAKYCIDKNDMWKHSLMSENYIEISFFLNSYVAFNRTDYILWDGDKFAIRNDYQPELLNKRKYKYTLKFEATEMFFKDIQYYYLSQGVKEAEWRLFGNPEYFIKIAVDNANRYFGITDFKMGSIEPTKAKDIVFDVNTTIFDALTQIAEEYDAEWYVTDKIIHLVNKLEYGDEVGFETEVSVLEMKRNEGDKKEQYTRILPLGSTRNTSDNYRETEEGESVDAVYSKRVRIPLSKGSTIDAYPNMTNDEAIEGTVIFDDIYPRRVGTIESINTIQYQDKDEETGKITKWDAYKIKDSGIDFKEEYLLPGEELRLQFVSGDLNGMDFALFFNKSGFSASDKSQNFEIVRSDDYGRPLPNATLKPSVGDQYVLYGFNIAMVGDQYVPLAEQELYDEAVKWLEKQLRDTSVYECPTAIKYFKENKLDLDLGQRVRLLLDKGGRSSRIMGFEKKLNNIYDAIYTIGDNPTYSRVSKIEQDLKELKVEGLVQGQGGNIYIIKNIDSTRPTDFNVLSSKRALNTFHRKDITDETDYLQKYNKGIEVGGFVDSMSHGKGAGIDEHGNAQFESVASRSSIITQEFIFNRLQANESDSVYTESGIIESVNEIEENTFLVQFKKRWETDFIAFHKDDILRGVVNTLTQGGAYYTSYIRVLDVNTSSNQATILVYPDSEVPAQKNYPPTELMIVHRWGNVTDLERQTTWFTSSREGRTVFLQGVNKPILNDNNYGSFWGLPIGLKVLEHLPINKQHPYLMARGIIYQDALKIDRDWNIVPTIVDRLDWKAGEHYSDGSKEPYEIHEVWYNGCKWRCLVDGTTQEPRWNATDWVLISGDSRLSLELSSSNGTLFRFGEVSTNFIATVYHGPNNITADIKNYDWEWTRDTGNINADRAWNEKNRDKTDILAITNEDVGVDFIHTRKATFICKVFVRQGENIEKLEKEIKL